MCLWTPVLKHSQCYMNYAATTQNCFMPFMQKQACVITAFTVTLTVRETYTSPSVPAPRMSDVMMVIAYSKMLSVACTSHHMNSKGNYI